ncbi:MAG: NAD(P)-dependent alcohol dehydrogenase [Acidimicrobiales bacterium]|jgi:NADPH:quinone reductase-like Zn-dependent oxidoreductase
MRAAVYEKYGPPEVEHLAEVDTPVPMDDEVLVRVHATTVNRTDCGTRRAKPFFLRVFTGIMRPRGHILGSEFAGEVDAVGASVTRFVPGDKVFGITASGLGTHAEFVCLSEDGPFTTMPANVSFEEAAAVCIGMTQAQTCLRRVALGAGRRVLVYGASGSIGTAAVQLAKDAGAHVTAVCSTKNLALVQSLGADEVIDYTVEDFTRNGQMYDVIFDAVGKHSFRRCRRSLVRGGIYSVADLGFLWQNPLVALVTSVIGTKRVKLPLERRPDPRKDVLLLKELIEAGSYRAVIDRCYSLSQIVEASEYVETGQKTGNVVLTIAS